jgi:hypothetical protein
VSFEEWANDRQDLIEDLKTEHIDTKPVWTLRGKREELRERFDDLLPSTTAAPSRPPVTS